MADTIYSSWSAKWSPSGARVARQVKLYITYTIEDLGESIKVILNDVGAEYNYGTSTHGNFTLTGGGSTYTQRLETETTAKIWSCANFVGLSFIFAKDEGVDREENIVLTCVWNQNIWGTQTLTLSVPVDKLGDQQIIFYSQLDGVPDIPKQYKYTGIDIQLTDNMPSAIGYTFLGWATSSGEHVAVSTVYIPGATITDSSFINDKLYLYAVWYKPPIFSSLLAYRVANDAAGSNPSVDNTSERGFARVNYISGYGYTPVQNQMYAEFGSNTYQLTYDTQNNNLYAYSGNTDCVEGSRTAVRLTITIIDNAGTIRNMSGLVTYISPQMSAFDIYKASELGTNNSAFNLAFGGYASESYEPTGRTDIFTNLYYKGSPIVDFVTEQGTDSSGWIYRKWYSGKREAWYHFTISGNSSRMNNSNAGAYMTGILSVPNFPSGLFTQEPMKIATAHTTNNVTGYVIVHDSSGTTNFGSLRIARGNSNTDTNVKTIDCYAIQII